MLPADTCSASAAGRHDYWFREALGELRAGVGLQLAIIAASFGLDVEDDLASTLPAPDEPASRPVP